MCFRFLVVSFLALALGNSGLLAADDHPPEGDHPAQAEADPGHDGGDHGAHGDGAHGDPEPFETALHGNAGPAQADPAEWKKSLSLWTLIVFGLLVGILWKFAWGPLQEALDQREAGIVANIAAAKEQNEKATALLAEHEARLAGTADEVRRILDEARRDAEGQKQQILADAQAAAESEKKRALQEIDAAKNGALQELAAKSVDTAVGLAGKIVQKQLSADDHASLISEALEHFPSKN